VPRKPSRLHPEGHAGATITAVPGQGYADNCHGCIPYRSGSGNIQSGRGGAIRCKLYKVTPASTGGTSYSDPMFLCNRCAVRLALAILEMEAL